MSLLLLVIAAIVAFFPSPNSFIAAFNVCQPIFFMAELISSTIHNLVSTRLEKKEKHENTAASNLSLSVCILMCNKIIRKFQGRKITSNYRREKRAHERIMTVKKWRRSIEFQSSSNFTSCISFQYNMFVCMSAVYWMPYNSNGACACPCACACECFCTFFCHSRRDWNPFFPHYSLFFIN